MLLFIASLDDLSYIYVALVGNNGFGVVVQLFFGCGNVGLNALHALVLLLLVLYPAIYLVVVPDNCYSCRDNSSSCNDRLCQINYPLSNSYFSFLPSDRLRRSL